MKRLDRIVQHLDTEYQRPIRDPLWQHIYVSDSLLELLDTKACRQLSRIKQLGPAYLVYPGATHTRFSHSLGVFHLAKRVIRTLAARGMTEPVSPDGVKAFLCASLLHDLGHFPYTHSFKELPLRDHEELTGELILSSPIREILENRVKVDPYTTAAIVDLSLDDRGDSEVTFFRRILSGTLDPDKLDYLNRDAYFCGVPYGMQDIDYVLSQIWPHELGLALDRPGVSAVENILFSKYLMYRAVYWHRTVRVATAMIKKAVFMALEDGHVTAEQLYGLDDDLFFLNAARNDHPGLDLIARVYDRALHQPVWETLFDPDNELHRRITDLDQRAEIEAACARRISRATGASFGPEAVILDVPERISFEVSLPVFHGDSVLNYPQSGTVFTPQVVEDFTRTLRRIRLIVDPEITEHVSHPEEYLGL